jgi:hypothetical protein
MSIDDDSLLYLTSTLLPEDRDDPAVASLSLARHHRVNKKAAARAHAAVMRAGGQAKRMARQSELEQEKRRSVKRGRVAAVRAAQLQEALTAEKEKARSSSDTSSSASSGQGVSVDRAKTKLHHGREL